MRVSKYVAPPRAPEGRVFQQVHTRKLDRSVAHARMKNLGYRKANKHDYATYQTMTGMLVQDRIGSIFSEHWREVSHRVYANM